jgi:uncharacterized protein (DUF433 family)
MDVLRAVSEDPRINCGYPVIRGTRTPVRVIVGVFRKTNNFERTAAMFPHLSREQIRDALDYYAQYPARVDEDIRWTDRIAAEIQQR